MREHRIWLLTLLAALCLLVGSDAFLGTARDNLVHEQTSLAAHREQLAREIKQLQDDATKAQELSRLLDAGGVEKYLAPVDRLQAIALLEPLASSARLRSFTYTLSPETDAEMHGLTLSSLAVQAEAPHDGDAYRFIDLLQRELPGRLYLQHLAIERMETALAAANVRVTATMEWLKNEGPEEEPR